MKRIVSVITNMIASLKYRTLLLAEILKLIEDYCYTSSMLS